MANIIPFEKATRRRLIKLGSKTKGTSNPLIWSLPKYGFLGGMYLSITGSVAGTLSAPNAEGMASIVRRVKLTVNAGPQLIDISGPGYHYGVVDLIDDYRNVLPSVTARDAVTAVAFDVSMYLPIMLNARDAVGLLALQNEATEAELSVEFETDATVATGATVTATVVPIMEVFAVPPSKDSYPSLSLVQQWVEDSRAISATGVVEYAWPRGNTYLSVSHLAGAGATGADKVNTVKLRINKSDDIIGALSPAEWRLEMNRWHGRAIEAGVIHVDLFGSSGLGAFGSARDAIYSPLLTDIDTVLDFSATTTLRTIRRQLVQVE